MTTHAFFIKDIMMHKKILLTALLSTATVFATEAPGSAQKAEPIESQNAETIWSTFAILLDQEAKTPESMDEQDQSKQLPIVSDKDNLKLLDIRRIVDSLTAPSICGHITALGLIGDPIDTQTVHTEIHAEVSEKLKMLGYTLESLISTARDLENRISSHETAHLLELILTHQDFVTGANNNEQEILGLQDAGKKRFQHFLNLKKKQTENAMKNLLKKYSLEDASEVIWEYQEMLSEDYLKSKGFFLIGKNDFHFPESKYVDEIFMKTQEAYRQNSAQQNTK
ncbi:MAG: hypothetical protein COY39_01930 [Alphaproteobacteria bacterium CG_4_10_14_0_8_um_filter_37_21]|nr:MAG: hypothetical protein COY39_01930 [Alphaproteobacteria bacterium CG_4_10_14_0_8_um_filter_37_21]